MGKAFFKNIRNVILDELKSANHNIKIAMAWFTNEEIFDALCSKLESGVKVDLIVINDYINNRYGGLDFQRFIKLGGSFFFSEIDSPVHNKFCLIDGQVLINGSYNWTYFAEAANWENIIVFKDDQDLINAFENEFKRITSVLKQVEVIIPLSIESIEYRNLFDAKKYLSIDYYQHSLSEASNKNNTKALILLESSLKYDKSTSLIQAHEDLLRKIKVQEEDYLKQKKLEEEQLIEIKQRSIKEEAEKEFKKGDLQYKQKKYDEAIVSINNAIKVYKVNPEPYMLLSKIYWKKLNPQLTREHAINAINYKTNDLEHTYNAIAASYFFEGQNYSNTQPGEAKTKLLKAIEFFDKCIALNPTNPKFHFNKALAFGYLPQNLNENFRIESEIRNCLTKTIEAATLWIQDKKTIKPNLVVSYAIRGEAHRFLRNYTQAQDDYLSAQSIYNNLSVEEKDEHYFDRFSAGLNDLKKVNPFLNI